jgi:hypothetical protein
VKCVVENGAPVGAGCPAAGAAHSTAGSITRASNARMRSSQNGFTQKAADIWL